MPQQLNPHCCLTYCLGERIKSFFHGFVSSQKFLFAHIEAQEIYLAHFTAEKSFVNLCGLLSKYVNLRVCFIKTS